MTVLQDIQRKVGVDDDNVYGDVTERAVAKALGIGPHIFALGDPQAFFAGVRVVTGALDDEQVGIINRLLVDAAHWPVGWLAYGLATAWHEARLKPVEEIGKGRGHDYGKVNGTGKAPYGRGLVQITWDGNYRTIDTALGLGGKLAKNYDLALDPDIAVKALVIGMERGLYTGKSLSSYIAPGLGTHAEFVNARRIINSTDRAEMIAGYADKFKDALVAGGWS